MVPSLFVLRAGGTHRDVCWVTVLFPVAAHALVAMHFACFIRPVPQTMAEMSQENVKEVIFWECARA